MECVQTSDSVLYEEGRLVDVPYSLKKVICHEGLTASKGHHFICARHSKEWYYISDLHVRLLATDVVHPSLNTKYVFMYTRIFILPESYPRGRGNK